MVDSAFHPSEVGEMSSSILMLRKYVGLCGSSEIPRWTPPARVWVHTDGAGMCHRVGVWKLSVKLSVKFQPYVKKIISQPPNLSYNFSL